MGYGVWVGYGTWARLDALAVPRDVQRHLLSKGASREAAVPHIGLAQDNNRLAEPPSGEQPEHALARAEVLRGKHDYEGRCLVDLLLDVDVVIVVIFIEVDLHDVKCCVCMDLARGQHGDEQG